MLTGKQKVVEWTGKVVNQGDDIAGFVSAVGKNVTEFKKGDRIAAFHQMMSPGGSYAEYALSWASTTFHIPASTSFEEAASIPLAAMTAAVGLYQRLGLPEPWSTVASEKEIPLLIWGGGTAVGSYAIQFAKKSGIHPLIVVAGRAKEHVQSLIEPEKGDVIIDYRDDEAAIIESVKAALEGKKLQHAYDAVSEHGSFQTISKILENPGGKITLVLPGANYDDIPTGIVKAITSVGCVHAAENDKDFGYIWFRYIAKGLQDGWFKGHPTQIVPGGLGGIQTALQNLKDGKASAVKYIFKIEDTEGVEKSEL